LDKLCLGLPRNRRLLRILLATYCYCARLNHDDTTNTTKKTEFSQTLVMFIPTGAFDVIPRGGLVALRTLVDSRVRLTSDASRNHLEVHHVVAGRRLVALGTVHRIGGRMLILGNGPAVGGMTLCAILAE